MKKLLQLMLAGLFLAGLLIVPVGCGEDTSAKKIEGAEPVKHAAGHDQAAKDLNKKPEDK